MKRNSVALLMTWEFSENFGCLQYFQDVVKCTVWETQMEHGPLLFCPYKAKKHFLNSDLVGTNLHLLRDLICFLSRKITKEQLHDKTNKMTCAQQRLRSAWASVQSDQSLLCIQWVAKDPSFLHADSEDSDQTGQMPRLIWFFAGRKCHLVGFVMRRLK